MTSEIEKQFMEVFGIEPKHKCIDGALEPCDEQCNECGYYELRYPQITDRILLKLILINMHNEDLFGYPNNIQELKDNTLKQLIETYNKFSICVTCDGEYQQSARSIKHQIQALFEENN